MTKEHMAIMLQIWQMAENIYDDDFMAAGA